MIGSPGYIAPEILIRNSYGPKVDIYSCGIILYFMLVRSPPFSKKSIEATLEANRRNIIELQKFPDISKRAKTFILELTQSITSLRPTANVALINPWFKEVPKSAMKIIPKPMKSEISKIGRASCRERVTTPA